jgi:hypothetical protein
VKSQSKKERSHQAKRRKEESLSKEERKKLQSRCLIEVEVEVEENLQKTHPPPKNH